MSTNAAQVADIKTNVVATSEMFVAPFHGRIESKRVLETQSGNVHLTVCRLPAEDEYSTPQTIEIRSKRQIGVVGDDISGKIKIGGIRNNFKTKAGEQVYSATNSFQLVE